MRLPATVNHIANSRGEANLLVDQDIKCVAAYALHKGTTLFSM